MGTGETAESLTWKRRAIILTILGGCGLMLLLVGFQVSPLRWPNPARLVFQCIPADLPEGMCARAQDAARMWNNAQVTLAVVETGAPDKAQGIIRSGSTQGKGRMGTLSWVYPGSSTMSQCVILVDPAETRWYVGRDVPPHDRYDAWTSLAHEMGHCLGLNHEDTAVPPALMRTLIHAGESQRALSPDDVAARDVLFPPLPIRRGGCAHRA